MIMIKFGEVNATSGGLIQGVEDYGNDEVHVFFFF